MTVLWGTYANDLKLQLQIAFGILSFIALICLYQTSTISRAKNHYQQVYTVRFLLPFVCLVVAIENAGLATSKLFFDDEMENRSKLQKAAISIMMALETTEVPILLLTAFDVCYLIHKRRSVNFCSMFFDEGHRVILVPTCVRGFILRNLFRMLAVFLLVLGIVVNFSLWIEDEDVSELAGKAGWRAVIDVMPNASDEAYLILSLIPEAVLIICSFYLSFVLWSYGTESSMVVHTSYFNPWSALFFGTICLTIGQVFNAEMYPFTSNLGLILFIFSIILLMYEVQKDLNATDDFAEFLEETKKYPNERGSQRNSCLQMSPIANMINGENNGENNEQSHLQLEEASIFNMNDLNQPDADSHLNQDEESVGNSEMNVKDKNGRKVIEFDANSSEKNIDVEMSIE